MINQIPFLGWMLDIALKASMAVPFWILWRWCGISEFFDFLPSRFSEIGFLDTIGLFVVLGILKSFSPFSVSSSSSSAK